MSKSWNDVQTKAPVGYCDLSDGSSWPAKHYMTAFEDLRDHCLSTSRSADNLLCIPPLMGESVSVMQDDLAKILEALDLGSHARPKSPHDVVIDEVLPAIRRLQASERGIRTYALELEKQLPHQPKQADGAGAGAQKSEEGAGGVAGPRFDPRELYEWAYAFHRDRECPSSVCHDRAVEFVDAAAGRLS